MITEKHIHHWNPLWICGLLLAFSLLLDGCAARTPVREPVTAKPAVKKETAAGSLLAEAHRAQQAGQYNQAEVALERALRVEPGNAGSGTRWPE